MTDIPEDVKKLARDVATHAASHVRNNADAEAVENIVTTGLARAILADRAAQAERMARLEAALTKMQAAVSWISAPFVDENTSHEELRKRIAFCVSHAALARALSQEGSDAL